MTFDGETLNACITFKEPYTIPIIYYYTQVHSSAERQGKERFEEWKGLSETVIIHRLLFDK